MIDSRAEVAKIRQEVLKGKNDKVCYKDAGVILKKILLAKFGAIWAPK